MIEKVEAHFFKNGVEERKETAGEEGLLENGSRELEILATDTRVKLVYDIPSGSPTFTFLSNGRRIIIIHIAGRLYNFYRKATY